MEVDRSNQQGGVNGVAQTMLKYWITIPLIVIAVLAGCGSKDGREARTIAEVVGQPLSPEELSNSIQDEQRVREEYIAECMRLDGFDYTPWLVQASMPPSPESFGLSDLEFAEKFGFGISTVLAIEPAYVPNPNDEIYANLDPKAQELYDLALYGPAGSEEYAVTEISGSTRGADNCQQYAYDQFMPDELPSAEVMQTYHELLHDINEQTLADPRVAAANNESIRCLREAGFDLDDEESVLGLFVRNTMELYDVEDANLETMQGSTSPDTILAIQAFERSLAITEFDCFENTNAITNTVRVAIEEQVVQDNYTVFAEAASGLRRRSDE